MFFYISLFSFFFFGIIKNEILKSKKGNFLIFLIIFLFCFSYQMGTDWLIYQNYYENIFPKMLWKVIIKEIFYIEKGYIILNRIFYHIGFSYEMFSGIISSICTFIILKFIKDNSKNYYLAIFIFLSQYFLGALIEPLIRQIIATTFFIISVRYIERKESLKYFLLIILAAQFHESAYFLLPVYFINYIKFSMKILFFILVSLKIMLEKVLPILLTYFYKYSNYLYFGRYSNPKGITFSGIVILSFYIFILYFIYSLKNKKFFYKFSFVFVIVYFASFYSPILNRINLYFSPFICIEISNLLKKDLKNIKKIFLKQKTKIINIIIVTTFFLLFSTLFFKRIIESELYKYSYFNYKNYIIEFMLGRLKENFDEKSSEYKIKIESLTKESKL